MILKEKKSQILVKKIHENSHLSFIELFSNKYDINLMRFNLLLLQIILLPLLLCMVYKTCKLLRMSRVLKVGKSYMI